MTTPLHIPDQRERFIVENDIETTMLVEAGAGSGKTTLMVKRLLTLIARGTPVERIAAVTFTRKAANELRERFEGALESTALETSDGELLARYRNALASRERMFVGTIHSFCSRVLREHAIQAGLPPDFTELDEVDEAVELERFWHSHRSLRSAEGDDNAPSYIGRLDATALDDAHLFSVFREVHQHRDATFPMETVAAPDATAIRAGLATMQRMVGEAQSIDRSKRCGIFDLALTIDRLARVTANFASPANVARVLRRLPRSTDGFIPAQLFGKTKASMQPMRDLRDWYTDFITSTVLPWEEQWAAHAYPVALACLRDASDAYEAYRREQGKLTFDDLLFATARLLRSDAAIRREISGRWTHLLVDEFQDTDPVQAEIAFLLAAPDASDGGDWRQARPAGGRLFVVGDPKQSIYRFRRADITTYEFVKCRIAECGAVLTLTSNFRSAEGIAQFVNTHFSGVFPPAVENVSSRAASGDAATRTAQAPFAPMNARGDVTQRTPGMVARYQVGGARFESDNVTCRADAARLASWIAGRIASKERVASDFLVLTSQRGKLRLYAQEFARRRIPVSVDGAPHDSDTLLHELVVVLRAIADPSNAVAVIAALEGLAGGVNHRQLFDSGARWDITVPPTGTDAVAEGLRQLHDWWVASQTMPSASLIERIIDDTMLLPLLAGSELGETRSGLLLFLVARVREHAADAVSIDGALRIIEETLAAENTAPPLRPHLGGALRLMNLHRAKGLEAKVVVLAAPVADAAREPCLITWRNDAGIVQAAFCITDGKATVAAPAGWNTRVAADAERDAEEHARLLYVATTRAEEELIVAQRAPYVVSGAPGEDKSAWAPLAPTLDPLPLLELDASASAPEDSPQLAAGAALSDAIAEIDSWHAAAAVPAFDIRSITEIVKQASRSALGEHEDDELPEPALHTITSDEGARLGMEMGSALHVVMEQIIRRGENYPVEQIVRAVAWHTWSHLDQDTRTLHHQKLMSLVRSAMASEAFATLQQSVTLPELPVLHVVRNGRDVELREGIVDAVAIQESSLAVVDWKVAASSGRFEALAEQYEAQGAAYGDILTARAGRPVSVVVQRVMP